MIIINYIPGVTSLYADPQVGAVYHGETEVVSMNDTIEVVELTEA